MKLFIAIDDTDNKESIGTGRLSRMLADMLKEKGLVQKSRVTRHQLLVHPDIPYTSHNSSACIDASMNACTVDEVFGLAKAFLLDHFNEGANPGLCIAPQDAVPKELPSLGSSAQKEVVSLDEAKALAAALGLHVWWGGETGQGCIGAMSAVGLRSTENDGRYIALDGIRDLEGMLPVSEMLRLTAIDRGHPKLGPAEPERGPHYFGGHSRGRPLAGASREKKQEQKIVTQGKDSKNYMPCLFA